MTLSGGDMLYITQLETQLKYIPRNRLTLGGMLSRLAEEDNILPLKVRLLRDLYSLSHFKGEVSHASVKLAMSSRVQQ